MGPQRLWPGEPQEMSKDSMSLVCEQATDWIHREPEAGDGLSSSGKRLEKVSYVLEYVLQGLK